MRVGQNPPKPKDSAPTKISPKNSQQKFLSLLELAKEVYDYKDEAKDFKRKREKLMALHKLTEYAKVTSHV